MKPPRKVDVTSPKAAHEHLKAIHDHLDKINKVLTNISYGSSVNVAPPIGTATIVNDPDSNMEGIKVIVSFPAAPNTDISIAHTLGRIPTGWTVLRLGNAGLVYAGAAAWTTTTLALRSTVGSQIALLQIF